MDRLQRETVTWMANDDMRGGQQRLEGAAKSQNMTGEKLHGMLWRGSSGRWHLSCKKSEPLASGHHSHHSHPMQVCASCKSSQASSDERHWVSYRSRPRSADVQRDWNKPAT